MLRNLLDLMQTVPQDSAELKEYVEHIRQLRSSGETGTLLLRSSNRKFGHCHEVHVYLNFDGFL